MSPLPGGRKANTMTGWVCGTWKQQPTSLVPDLEQVLVVAGERCRVEFVDELRDADHVTLGVFDGHAEDRPSPKSVHLIRLQSQPQTPVLTSTM